MSKVTLERVPPNNLDAERAVLGALMLEEGNVKIPAVQRIIQRSECFYRDAHRMIYDSILELYNQGITVDLLSVSESLTKKDQLQRVGDVQYLDEIIDSVPSTANVEYYANMVLEEYIRRKIINNSAKSYNDAFNKTLDPKEILANSEKNLIQLSRSQMNGDGYSSRDLSKLVWNKYRSAAENPGSVYMKTGFPDFDNGLGGLERGQYVILAARAGMGKSSFAHSLAINMAKNGYSVVLFSAEMKAETVGRKMISIITGISDAEIKSGQIKKTSITDFTIGAGKLGELPIKIYDTALLTTTDIRSKIIYESSKKPVDLVIVDYLQWIHEGTEFESRQYEMAYITNRLAALSREMNCCIIAISQLNRNPDMRSDKRPQLSDLRESGAIEQDADLVLFLYRDDYYDKSKENCPTELIVAKNRDGNYTGTINLHYLGGVKRYYCMAKDYQKEMKKR